MREITRMVRELEDAEEKYDVARINERVGMNADSLDVIRLKVEQHAADAAIHLPNVTKEKAESEKAPFEVGEYALWVGLNKESSIETGVVVKIDSIEKRPDFTSGWRITCSGMKVQFPIDLYEYDLSWFKKIVDPNEGDKQ